MKWIPSLTHLIDRLCIIAGVFAGSQIPEFIQQYSQRLAGHVHELERLLAQLRQTASYSNKTLDQYIQKFMASSDPDFASQGHFMNGIFTRWEELNQALNHLSQSSPWSRPFIFWGDFQYDIARSAFDSFQPAINLTLEGLCYAGLGGVAAWALFRLISAAISRCFSSRPAEA